MPPMYASQRFDPRDRRAGAVLFLAMAMLAILTMIAATVMMATQTDLRITRHHLLGANAFNQADAGVNYVQAEIERDLRAGILSWQGPVQHVNYTAPAGFEFDPVTTLTQLPDTNAYVFTVTGRARESRVQVTAVARRRPLLEFGIFGNHSVDLKPYANVYGYHSSTQPHPHPGDSEGNGDTASNGIFSSYMGTFIDGALALGEDETGVAASWHDSGDSIITGDEAVEVDHIVADPLGAQGGDLAAEFAAAATSNDNGSTTPPITGPQYAVSLGNGDTMTLRSGTYYIRTITLNNSATLDIDASSGPVRIFLTSASGGGKLEAKNGSSINFLGLPTDISIYSNASAPITLKHSGNFQGLIYAPYAQVIVMNSADFYGLVWAEDAEIKNAGNFFIDRTLTDHRYSSDVYLAAWKDVR